MESIFNERLNHWIEQNFILLPNMYGFRNHTISVECVSTLVADIRVYLAFIRKEYLYHAVFLDFRSTYPCVHIPTLLKIMTTIGISLTLTKFIGKLLSHPTLHFSPADTKSIQIVLYRGLAQGDPLSPTLLNLYALGVARRRSYDIVLYHRNSDLALTTSALEESVRHVTLCTNKLLPTLPLTNASRFYSPCDLSILLLPKYHLRMVTSTG